MINDEDEKRLMQERYINDMLTSKEPEILRIMLMESLSVIGKLARRSQIHMMLHPLFYLAGFISAYLIFGV